MGGPRVPPKTERLIISIWMSLSKESKKPTASEVLTAAEAYTKAHNLKDIFLPKIRKCQDIIRDAKRQYEYFSPAEKILQKPWSMATLDEYQLSPESLPSVARVWRYTLITGEQFTIRQAKWVSRLYDFQPDVTLLWLTAYEYAKREEASLLSNCSLDTFNDDLRLVFTTLEVVTIWKTVYGDQHFPDPFTTTIPRADDGGIMHEVLHPVDYYNALYNNTVSNNRDRELHYLLAKMPSFDSLGLVSNELRVVYLIWITHIKQRPEWQSISSKDAADVVLKLREWALKQQSIKFDLQEQGKDRIAARIKDNQVFIEELPTPDKVLNLLSKYATKGETKCAAT